MGIRVIACRVGSSPQVEELDHSLEAMQQFVGGELEKIALGDLVALICSREEGSGAPPNRYLPLSGGQCLIRGDFFIAAHTGDEFASMPDDQVETWTARAADWPKAE